MQKSIESWKNLVTWAYNFFSVPLLFKTLFSPWEMDRGDGSEFSWFEKIIFYIFSRVLGFVARVFLIVLGLTLTIIIIALYPVFMLIPINIDKNKLVKIGSIGSSLSYGNTYDLNRIGKDKTLSSEVEIFGKERALRMVLRALAKDANHNVLLVGDVGVGKDTLIDYLGKLGESGLAEAGIVHHRVVELPLENISAEDMINALDEARDAGNVILVVKSLDRYESIYEKLLPYLDSKNLAIIATTELGGYDRVLKVHPEFLAKFEKVDILPPSHEETMQIVLNYALYHNINISKEVVDELVTLAGRYIMNESEPQKSILIFDELRALAKKEITIADVRQIISDKTNVPLGALEANEKEVLQNLESTMLGKIIGQEQAVKEVAQALKRLRAGIANPTKPAGSFLFLGPTGVGKTYTAKVLAESYFGRRDAMLRFDMSEFALQGSLPIFADRLASAIEESPMSLVFFDELEKSHRDIHQLLLQVLDEGMFTRENGRVANFRNAIIIATSNAGSREIIADSTVTRDYLLQVLIRDQVFSPEFLNRFSSIVLFLPMSQKDVRKVSRLLLIELSERLLNEKNINLVVTDELVEKVAEVGFDPNFGARPIHRAIEEIVENKIAELIIEGKTEGEIKIL